MPPLEVRSLQPDDLPALMAVQRAAYGDGFMESTEVFARRLASPVNCSLALLLDGALCAYLAAYYSVQGKVTPLHGDFEPPLGTAPDTLYLHDMAVLPGMAGKGLARRLLQPLSGQVGQHGHVVQVQRVGRSAHGGLKVAMQRRHLALHRVIGRQVGAQSAIQQQGQ